MIWRPSRRDVLRGIVPATLGPLVGAPVVLSPLAASSAGCAAIAGEETIDAFFYVGKGTDSDFGGWTEYNLKEAPDEDQEAVLERVLLRAPGGFDDLTFILELFAEAVQPDGTRTPLARADGFPQKDTMGPLEILYHENLRPLLYPDGRKLRIEWSGKFDPNYPYPDGGVRVEALIVIEIL